MTATAAEGLVSYSGTAVDRHSGKLLYGERDVVLYREHGISQRVVLYTCRDGSASQNLQTDISFPFADRSTAGPHAIELAELAQLLPCSEKILRTR
jgi:hypothetical protein